jgi:hypothetical protein
MATPKNIIPKARIILAMTFMIIGVLGSFKLIISGFIGGPSFIVLVCISALISFVIAFNDRIELLSFRELKIVLAKVESARKEVEEREQSIRRITLGLSEIIMFFAAFNHRAVDTKTYQLESQWLEAKVRKLLSDIAVIPPQEQEEIFRFIRATKEADEKDWKTNPEAYEAAWHNILKKISDELK